MSMQNDGIVVAQKKFMLINPFDDHCIDLVNCDRGLDYTRLSDEVCLLKSSKPHAFPFSMMESVIKPERAIMRISLWKGFSFCSSISSLKLSMCNLECILTSSLRPAFGSCLILLHASKPFMIGMSRSSIITSNFSAIDEDSAL